MSEVDFSELSDEELKRVISLLEEEYKEVERTYVPHAKQKAFHCSDAKVRGVFGGNRSGKTEMGVNEARFHSTGEYPDWYPESRRFTGPTRGRIVVADYKHSGGEVLVPKLLKWFDPKDIIKKEYVAGNLVKVYVRHKTGGVSTFDIMTYEQDTKQFEGWNGHWVWFDEPPPRDIYISCLRGLVDFDGYLWITATPIGEPWLYDEIILNTKRKAWHIAVSIYDNPYLTKKAIEEFLVSLTPEEEEARIHGKFMHLSGRVYGEFDTSVHLIDTLPKGHEMWPVWFVLDPADRRPHHAIWAKVDPFNTIYVFDEFVFKGNIKETTKEFLCREVVNKIRSQDVIRILDPNKGRTASAQGEGLVLVDEFAAHGAYFTTNVSDKIDLGHLAVKELLSYNKKEPISSTNHPKIYFLKETTRECVKQFLSYVWDEWRGRLQGGRSEKEKPKDLNKDMPDCIRYLAMFKPRYYDNYDGPPRDFRDSYISRTGYDIGENR